MSQKQKSILSFFKQAEPSSTTKKAAANSDSKSPTVKKEVKESDSEDPKNTSLNGKSKVAKKDKSLNGSESKKATPKKKVEKSIKKESIDDSPIKQPKKRKRATILESDDDSQSSDEQPNKKHEPEGINGAPSNNGSNSNEDGETEPPQNVSEADSTKQSNGTSSSAGHSSEQQDEPMEEDEPTEMAIESKDKPKNKSNDADMGTASKSSSIVPDLNVPDFIPKRKTARKQMRSGQPIKEIIPETSDGSSKSSSTNVENKTPSTDNSLESIKLKTENSSEETMKDDNESDSNNIPQDDIKKESENSSEESMEDGMESDSNKIKDDIKKESENSNEETMKDGNESDSNKISQDDIKKKSEDSSEEIMEDGKKSDSNKIPQDDIKKESEAKETENIEKENKCSPKTAKKETKTKETKAKNVKKEKKSSPKNVKKQSKTKETKTKKEKKNTKKAKEQVSDIKAEPSSDNENSSQDEKEENSPKSKTEDSNSKTKIHPFFGKNKNIEASSQEENTDKKPAKVPAPTGTIYDPSKNRYHPIDDACWKRNEKVPYLALAKTLDLIENISGRLKMIEILSNYFRSVIVLTPEDLLQSVYLCLNRLAPEHEGIELGIGELLLIKALAQATGRTTAQIKAEVAVKGDLGLVAESSRGNQRLMFAPPKLTVSSVFSKFKEIALMTGNTVMSKKTDKIQALFVACRECEAKYIIRSLSGKLRIGLAEQSILAALARAAVMTPPNQSYPPEIIDKSSKMGADAFKEYLNAQTLILKTTYCECPNYDLMIPVLLKEDIAGLPEHCHLTAGFPLKPMLAHPTNGIDEVLNRFDKNEFTCEFKYDGERAQIHRTGKGEIKIYSRNQEDTTSKYPDVISRLPKILKESTKSFILDTEAVAWDSETKQILPFQVLSTRKKKDAVESDIVVQVCIMAFDLLYLNGESLVKKSLKERREQLHAAFTENENEFMFVTYRDGNSAETMQEFLDESIKGNCEGLMVKALTVDASYEIAKRSRNWLKLKKDYLAGVGDTLDLMVIGGYHGKGKRAGNYGGFLLACYDDENEEFQSICKLGTGFSDVDLETHSKFFKEHIINEPKSYYRYDSSLEPDVWFDAVQIWEIKCADLSISPIHKAAIGIVDPEKGISLRFPRFLRIRDDKTKPEDATVSSQVAEMYEKQDQVQNSKKDVKTEEDYY